MIQNEHQYKVTQNKLKDLEGALVKLIKIKDIVILIKTETNIT
jgi:hypothetical protein